MVNFDPRNLKTIQPTSWGAPTPEERGPLILFNKNGYRRNTIGAPGGPYAIYAAMAEATGQLSTQHRPNFEHTDSGIVIPVRDAWSNPKAIVSLDPFGHQAHRAFAHLIADGADIRPTITMTTAKLDLPDFRNAIDEHKLVKDGKVVGEDGQINVVKISIDPVWYLPGIAARFGITENYLRQTLVSATNGMNKELTKRRRNNAYVSSVYLPPIGGSTVYIFGDINRLADPKTTITARPHDECNGSDVFGADICTCRPYLIQGMFSCIEEAQNGGLGLIVYNRKEGRALGETIKLSVYNARKNQPGGDTPEQYFPRTEAVAGIEDARLQPLMTDILVWLGIWKIDHLLSMSNIKYEAILKAGIEVGKRTEIEASSVPLGARTEISAKIESGYYTERCKSDILTPQ